MADRPGNKHLFADDNVINSICQSVIVPAMEFRGETSYEDKIVAKSDYGTCIDCLLSSEKRGIKYFPRCLNFECFIKHVRSLGPKTANQTADTVSV